MLTHQHENHYKHDCRWPAGLDDAFDVLTETTHFLMLHSLVGLAKWAEAYYNCVALTEI